MLFIVSGIWEAHLLHKGLMHENNFLALNLIVKICKYFFADDGLIACVRHFNLKFVIF